MSILRNYLLKKTNKKKGNELVSAIGNRHVIGRYPLNIQIQTVSACNASCYFCPYPESWHKQNPGGMSDEVYAKIIEEVSPYKIDTFCPYLENEPLLDVKIFDRIEHAISKLDYNCVEVATNASVLDEMKCDDLIRSLQPGKNLIRVSFHGIDKDTYNSIMGLDFETSKNNVLRLVEKVQNRKINVEIRGSGLPRTQKGGMPKWFSKKDYLLFWKKEFSKAGFKKIPSFDYFTYHDRAGQIARNEINFSDIVRPDLNGFYCVRADQWLHFLYTGELILCCMDYNRETVLGDITKNTLEEILNSKEFLNLISQTVGKTPAPDDFICKKCISPGG